MLSLQDFLGRVTQVRHSIRQLSADIERIGQLHQRSLSSVDGSVTSQLDALSAAVQQRAASIRDDLHALHVDRQRTNGASRLSSPRITKTKQIDQLKRDFSRALEDYRSREVAFRSRYRDQIARQYRVANPDATEEEIARAADEDWGSEGVFQAAVGSPQ